MARLKPWPFKARLSLRAVSAACILRWFAVILTLDLIFVMVIAGGGILWFYLAGVFPIGALVPGGERALVAVIVIVADVFVGGEFLALRGGGHRLHLPVDLGAAVRLEILRGDLHGVEELAGALGIDAAVNEGVSDFRDGELDRGGALGSGETHRAVLLVLLGSEAVKLGVEIAEIGFPEGW